MATGRESIDPFNDSIGAFPPIGDTRVSALNSLKRRIGVVARNMNAILAQGLKTSQNASERPLFMVMCKGLENSIKNFDELWNTYGDSHESLGQDFPTKEQQTIYDEIYQQYYQILLILEECKPPIHGTLRSDELSPNCTNNSSTILKSHLPKILLPTFDGDILKWNSFRDTFSTLVDEDPTLSDMTKLHYLDSSLRGKAKSVISHLPFQATSYSLAWKALNETYENNRLIASTYLNKLFCLKPLKGKLSPDYLDEHIILITETVAAFNQLKIEDPASFIIYCLAARGIDSRTIESFEKDNNEPYPSVDNYIKFLRQLSKNLRSAQIIAGDRQYETNYMTPQTKFSGRNKGSALLTESKPHNSICPYCSQDHKMTTCKIFLELTPSERLHRLRSWNGCKNCLAFSHRTKSCPSTNSCSICQKRHHSKLHLEIPSKSHTPSSASQHLSVDNDAESKALSVSTRTGGVILGTAMIDLISSSGRRIPARVIIDCGSQHSFITTRLANILKGPIENCALNIRGIGEATLGGIKGQISCTFTPWNKGSPQLSTNAVIVEHITGNLPSSDLNPSIAQMCSAFTLADPTFMMSAPIDFLLGADIFPLIVEGRAVQPISSGPLLLPTSLGFVIMGPNLKEGNDAGVSLFSKSDDDLTESVKRFWTIEDPPGKVTASPSETAAELHFSSTHKRNEHGRYIVKLPFKSPPPCLAQSEKSALNRFYRVEASMMLDSSRKEKYQSFMDDYEDLGHMSLTSKTSLCVLPHHSVMKDSKIRVVFDASSSTANGSLNDHLLTGPKLQSNIGLILLNFRLNPIAFTSDITKMFRQILVAEEDRAYQHIFWRRDRSQNMKKFELNTLTYGMSCSPFIAQRVINQLCEDEGLRFPDAARVLTTSIYVDDIVTGSNNVEGAVQLKDDLINLLSLGGFQLSKWSSNCPEILPNRDECSQLPVLLTDSSDSAVKVLGLQWNPIGDYFSYKLSLPEFKATKRSILSVTARIYDPLGFLAPVTLTAKSFVQEAWKEKLSWDQPLTGTMADRWSRFFSELPELSNLTIPRFILPLGAVGCRVVGFCDASLKGYAATIYLRVETANEVETPLILAKTKLAPLKTLSIPRLELCGALLLAKAYESLSTFLSGLSIPILDPYFCTDSQIVLHWLKTETHNLKTFVGNRVSEIITLTPVTRWFHVGSQQNPSDLSSRGVFPSNIINLDKWWQGPPWLAENIENWPVSQLQGVEPPTNFPELRTSLLTESKNESDSLLEWTLRFSSFPRLVRSFGYVKRFIHNARKDTRLTGPISTKEFRDSCQKLVLLYQGRHFHPLPSGIEGLSPFLDNNGVLRVGGRICRARFFTSEQKHPILLPKKCHLTNILLDFYHKSFLHPGPGLLQSLVQSKFWIPSLRRLARRRTFLCISCYRNKPKKPFSPMMSDLPECRLTALRPFIKTGVDYAGPYNLKTSSRRNAPVQKGYLCIFICMSTKAVHLEVVSSLTTESFIATFSRFIARRGCPKDMYSDRGTNFVGAAKDLKDLYDALRQQKNNERFASFLAEKSIEWHFNPPLSPHFGGLWEAAVRSAKVLLRRTVGEVSLTYEEFATLFTRIEAVLNSRPLCPLSPDPNETSYLTPGHFLIGDHLTAVPEASLIEINANRLNRWQLVQKIHQDFWARWKNEYVLTLQHRSKWKKKNEDPAVGDLVIIKDKRSRPLEWPMARIKKLFPGKDGTTRVVELQTGGSTFIRSVHTLVPLLPLKEDPYESDI